MQKLNIINKFGFKMKLVASILISQAISAGNANATSYHYERNERYSHYSHVHNCVEEYYYLESETYSVSKSCKQTLPLNLATKNHYYPKLNSNPRTVEYWQGQYSKLVTITRTYSRELVDVCRGRVISSRPFIQKEHDSAFFDIKNPNLSPDISESFMLLPMTAEEAKNALVQARQSCELYDPF